MMSDVPLKFSHQFAGLFPLTLHGFLLVFIVLGLGFAVVKVLFFRRTAEVPKGLYVLRETLFTPAERSFLGVLDSVLPAGVRVFGKVRIEDLVSVRSGLKPSVWQAAKNRISRKHVDFLLVRFDDLSPLAAIELDDRSHEAKGRQQRDAFVGEALGKAGLKVIRFAAQATYAPAEVKAKLVGIR